MDSPNTTPITIPISTLLSSTITYQWTPLWAFLLCLVCCLITSQTAQAQRDTTAGRDLEFDGSTQFVDTKYLGHLRKFTVECWVNSPNAPAFNQGKGPVHYEENFQFNWDHVSAAAQGAVVIRDSTGSWQAASFGPLLGGVWYHLAATYDGDTLRSYVNGRLITANGAPNGPPKRELNSLKIGKHAKLSSPQFEFFNGEVDEVRVWDVVLPADSIRLHIHHPRVGNEFGLILYYPLNEGRGDSTVNMVNGVNAPLIARPLWRSSGISLGQGISSLVSVQGATVDFFGGELKAQVSAPTKSLMATKINQLTQGLNPQGAVRNRLYLINQFDNSPINLVFLTITEPQNQRLAFYQPNQPRTFIVGYRWPSFGDFTSPMIDTVSRYDSTAGIYHFNRPAWGQLVVGQYSGSLVSLDKDVPAKAEIKLRAGYGDQSWILLGRYSQLTLHDQIGRAIHIPAGQTEILHHNLPSGLYRLTGFDQSGKLVSTQVLKW